MKSKTLMAVILVTAVFFIANSTFAQCEDKHKNESSKSNSENCCSKTGNSSGTLDSAKVCPVSGEEVGQGVKYTYLGKEYTFCCEGCVKKFKAEPMNYIKEEVICPVMGENAKKDVFTVFEGVKYYFCCEPCISKFKKDPSKYLNKEG